MIAGWDYPYDEPYETCKECGVEWALDQIEDSICYECASTCNECSGIFDPEDMHELVCYACEQHKQHQQRRVA